MRRELFWENILKKRYGVDEGDNTVDGGASAPVEQLLPPASTEPTVVKSVTPACA